MIAERMISREDAARQPMHASERAKFVEEMLLEAAEFAKNEMLELSCDTTGSRKSANFSAVVNAYAKVADRLMKLPTIESLDWERRLNEAKIAKLEEATAASFFKRQNVHSLANETHIASNPHQRPASPHQPDITPTITPPTSTSSSSAALLAARAAQHLLLLCVVVGMGLFVGLSTAASGLRNAAASHFLRLSEATMHTVSRDSLPPLSVLAWQTPQFSLRESETVWSARLKPLPTAQGKSALLPRSSYALVAVGSFLPLS